MRPPPPRDGRGTRIESQRTTVRRSSLMVGAMVNLRGGHEFGKIEEFVIDDGGCVEFVVVAHENKFVAVPFVVANFDFEKRTFLLDIDRARLARMPTFTDFSVLATREFRQRNESFFGRRDGRSPVSTPRDRDDQDQPRQPGAKDQPGTQPKQPGTVPPGTRPPGAKPPRGTVPGTTPPAKPAPQPGTQPKPQPGGTPKEKP